jgi:hypothetical protein
MARSRVVRHGIALAAFGAVFALTRMTAADARDIATRVEEQWKALGARTAVIPTRFLFDEETVLVPIAPAEERDTECTEVAVLGARGLSFRASLSDAPVDPLVVQEPAARGSSTAGVLALRRCGGPPVRHVVITAEAGRGAVEVVVGRSLRPLSPLASLLPERTGGLIPPPAEAGALPILVGQEKRAEAAEIRARREGGIVLPRLGAPTGPDGSGEVPLELDEGCHRIEVFGGDPARYRTARRFRLDVDAELREADHLLVRDRTEAPDARLETCVGTPTKVILLHAGSPPGASVIVTRATWPLPARLPQLWGPSMRSKMARVMFLRHVAVPAEDPIYLAQGSTGTTPLPLSVEAGGCYVAVVGVGRGRARQLQIRVQGGGRESTDERGAADEAALSAFCVRAHESPKLEVIARGMGLHWGLALFRVRSGVWESGR